MNRSRLLVAALSVIFAASCSNKRRSAPPAPPVDTRSTIRLTYDDGAAYARAGIPIFVDEVQSGVTDAAGEARIQLAAGPRRIRAFDPGSGAAIAEVVAGTAGANIGLTMFGDLDREVEVSCPQATGGSLSVATTAIEILVASIPAAPITIASFTVLVEDARVPGPSIDLSPLFTTGSVAGSIVATDVAAFFAATSAFVNDIRILVAGTDGDGATFEDDLTLFIGRHTLDIALVAPPSNPGLGVAAVEVSATLIGTEVSFRGVSDAQGRVSFAPVPIGTYELFATVVVGNDHYSGNTAQFVNGNVALGLRLLGLPDVINGVAGATVYQDSGETVSRREGPIPPDPASTDGGGISVTSSTQGQTVTNDTSVTFAAGTKKVKLAYSVVTVEYPFYVLSQSIFNDNWSLRVLGPSGQLLRSVVRNVNSQVSTPPVWLSGTAPGTTGPIEEEIDISALTAGGAVALTLVITATNIGDSLLPTTVTADLRPSDFRIQAIAASPVRANYSCGQHTKPQTQQRQFSIPVSPEFNVDQRRLFVDLIGRPEGAEVTRVKVDLRPAGATTVLATVVDEAPSTNGRVVPNVTPSLDRLEVTVTSSATNPSPIAGASPPPADQIEYHVTVEVGSGASALSADKSSPTYNALWKAALGDRTGCRDSGGDEWAARGTILWLATNRALLGAVNDISGEHDRNLGHSTHVLGKSIDFRPFTTSDFQFTSGLRMFQAVRDAALAAINGDTAAATRVDAWFVANRDGLGALADLASVTVLYVAASPAVPAPSGGTTPTVGLPAGWFVSLLKDGAVVSGTRTLTLASGAWGNANAGKVTPLAGHLDHHHLTIDPAP